MRHAGLPLGALSPSKARDRHLAVAERELEGCMKLCDRDSDDCFETRIRALRDEVASLRLDISAAAGDEMGESLRSLRGPGWGGSK